MKLIVVGCGRTGAALARSLDQKGHQVSVIDNEETAFSRLGPDFKGRTFLGVAFDRDVLLRAGIDKADGLAAVTDDEAANMIVCQIARLHYHVPNVVSRLFEPDRAVLYDALDIPTVSSIMWRVRRIEQILCQPTMSVVGTLGNGEVQVVEIQVTEGLVGRVVRDFVHPGRTTDVALLHGGRASLPTMDAALSEGDYLRLAVFTDYLDEFETWLHQIQKEVQA